MTTPATPAGGGDSGVKTAKIVLYTAVGLLALYGLFRLAENPSPNRNLDATVNRNLPSLPPGWSYIEGNRDASRNDGRNLPPLPRGWSYQ